MITKLSLMLVLVLAGCKSDSTGPSQNASIVGNWAIVTWNGKSLPVVTNDSGNSQDVLLADSFTATATSYSHTESVKFLPSGIINTFTDTRPYAQFGNTYTFNDGATGILVNGSLSIRWLGSTSPVSIYKRN